MKTLSQIPILLAVLLVLARASVPDLLGQGNEPPGGAGPVCFDFAQGLPAGSSASGTTPPFVAGGVLHLTDPLPDQGNYWITPIRPQIVQALRARWRLLIGGGTTPGADGVSFNLGTDLGTGFIGEEGGVHGLSVSVDTWDNGIQDVGLEIKWNGQRVGFTRVGDGTTAAQGPLRANQFMDAVAEVSAAGAVTFSYAGFTASAQLPNYRGIAANQYVFAARTGGANDRHWIDDVCVQLTERPAADLQVLVPPWPGEIIEGGLLPISVTVSNAGPGAATGVRLTFSLPRGAILVAPDSDPACVLQGSNVVCSVDALAAQQSFTVPFVLGVDPQFVGQTAEEFWWWDDWVLVVAANERDPNLQDNQRTGIVRVWRQLDFPDGPASYGTLLADNAARHAVTTPCRLLLGHLVDAEPDGRPSTDAQGDDKHQSPDDEDGITFLDPLVPGATGQVRAVVDIIPAACRNCAILNAWMDFNRDGVFDPTSERIFQDVCLASGTHTLNFTVPAGASNGVTYARFRLTSATGTAPLGFQPDGEVEDYIVTIGEAIGTRRWIAVDGQAAPGAPVNVEVLEATATQTRVRIDVPGAWLVTDWYAGQRFYHLEFVPGEFKGVGFPNQPGARSWYDFPADSGQPLLSAQRYRRALNITPVPASFPAGALDRHPRTATEMEALGIDPAGARPGIPALRATLAVSRRTTPKDLAMRTLSQRFQDLSLAGALKPAGYAGLDQQAPDVSEGYTPPELVDETFYGSFAGEYAGTESTFSAVSGMGGFAGVQVRLPLLRATSPHDVQVVASMEIQFDHPLAVVDLPCPPHWDVWVHKAPFLNGAAIVDGLLSRGLVASATRAARYLIITPRDWADSFTDFASWKTLKGLNVDYAYVGETVAGDRASIDAYIESYYATHWCRGVYVLLAGDVDIIESGRSAYTIEDPTAESDHVYEVIGGDTVASVYVGRLSANTEEELQIQLAKILSYERDPVPGDWPYHITLAANSQNDDESFGVSTSFPSKYAACINEIADYVYSPYLSGSFQVLHAGAASAADPRAVNQDVIDAINAGRGQVLYRGHGGSTSWAFGWDGSSTYGVGWSAGTHVPQLNNIAYPIVYGIACNNNRIASTDCLGETFMSRAGGGAVAYFGASLASYTTENHERAKGIFKAQWDSGIRTLGPMLAEAERFSALTSTESKWLNNTFGYLLLGDPEMSVKPPATILDMSLYVDTPLIESIEGDPLIFSLTVSNGAALPAIGVELRATLPPELTVQSISSSQGACSLQGREVVCALADLGPHGVVTVSATLVAVLGARFTDDFMNLDPVVWSVAAAGTDRHPEDNQSQTTVRVRPKLDFPDAPVSYKTLRVDNAARHGGDPSCLLLLGSQIDREPDGQPSPLADGDDIHGGPDDGDGITFLDPLIPGTTARARVVVSFLPATCWNCGVLNAWVDFDRNGVFDPVADRIITDQCLPAGTHEITFLVPPSASSGASYARFRLTSTAGTTPTGFKPDGEVEDYPVAILPNPVAVFGGFTHTAGGGATLTAGPSELRVANLNSTNDTVRIDLHRLEGWRGDLASFETLGDLTFTARGAVGGQTDRPLHSLRLARTSSNLTFTASFAGLGASRYQAEFFDSRGVRLETRLLDEATATFLAPCTGQSGAAGFKVCHIEVFADSIRFVVCTDCLVIGGLPGDIAGPVTVQLTAVHPTVTAPYLSAVEIGGGGGTAFTFAAEGFQQGSHWHQLRGNARLQAWPDDWEMPWFQVSNLGASGQDGLMTYLRNGEAYDATLAPVDLKPAGRSFRGTVVGRANGTDGSLLATVELAGDGSATRMTFGAALFPLPGWSVSAWDESALVADQQQQSSGAPAMLSPEPGGEVRLQYFGVDQDRQNRLVLELEFAQPVTASFPGGAPERITRVRAVSSLVIENLEAVSQDWISPGAIGLVFFGRDYGDAPIGYPVTPAENGARHRRALNWQLGVNWDRDFVVAHSAYADFDDLNGPFGLPSATDDEDGVVVVTAIGGIQVHVTSAVNGFLDAWLDFDRNASWAEPGNRIATAVPLLAGVPRTFNLAVPAGTLAGPFFSRWRLSETGGLPETGYGGKGEVEDHVIFWQPEVPLDFGDAPDASYATYLASGGPSHVIVAGEHLGGSVDAETDGQPVDLDGADEDGVTIPPLVPGTIATLSVVASVAGHLDAWIDFNANGQFDIGAGSPEPVCVAVPLVAGLNLVPINVPGGAVAGGTWARFRFSLAGGLPPGGAAPDGEVEDYGPTAVVIGGGNPNPVDLAVVATPATVEVTEGETFTSSITVSNRGPGTATSVRLMTGLPPWPSFVSATSTAGNGGRIGSNYVHAVPALAPGETFTVTLTLNANPLADGASLEFYDWDWIWVVTTAEPELTTLDNQLVLPVIIAALRDFGDAPSPPYPTCLPSGGRHRVVAGGLYRLGTLIDSEPNCRPDDNLAGGPDEDGVVFNPPPPWLPGTVVTPTVTVMRPAAMVARLDAWFDADGTPGFDPADRIYAGMVLPIIGPNVLPPFTVPATAPAGVTWLRFRLSQAGVAGPGGYAPDGEVEDYSATILPALPDVGIALQDLPSTAGVGSPVSHGVVIRNTRAVSVDGVEFVVRYAGALSAAPIVMVSQGTFTVTGNEVRGHLGTLAPGATAQARITVSAVRQESIAVEARVAAPLPDADPLNDRADGIVVLMPALIANCTCACATNSPWPTPDPLLSSWYTAGSGQYARVRHFDGGPLETRWEGGHLPSGLFVDGVYADIQKIQDWAGSVYVTANGLASHVMGPWYCDTGRTVEFPNKPLDLRTITRIPRNAIPNSAHPVTPMGAIGIWVNGTAVYNSLDGFYYLPSQAHDTNEFPIFGPAGTSLTGYLHRDAYFSEFITFDPAIYHQQEDGQYHAHANPLLLRYQVGDNIVATRVSGKTNYVEQSDATQWKHSPILGWSFDGHPIYGPYGYSDPMDTNSSIQRMRSGYVLRDGREGTTDLRKTGRTTLPAWTICMQGRTSLQIPASEYGPDPASTATTSTSCNPIEWSLGRYAEDYAYLGDLKPDSDYGVFWDLDRYNGRCCKTPEFPNGTYAYFVTLDTNGTPAFPYIIGWQYCSTNSGGPVTDPTELADLRSVPPYYSAILPRLRSLDFGVFPDRQVTIQWDSREGASYQLLGSTNLQDWAPVSPVLPSQGTRSSVVTTTPIPNPPPRQFYRMELKQDGGGMPR